MNASTPRWLMPVPADFDPLAIMLFWSRERGYWVATAVCAVDPIEAFGPSSSWGTNPGDALAGLMTKRFAALTDNDCPATMIALEVFDAPDQVAAHG
ncbi:MAG: hypothetical protein V4475_01745 [Pseudomonadota bacterium]